MKTLEEIVARNLAELRKAKGLTQLEVAEHFNYTDKSVSKWEHGDALPDVKTLQSFADFYGVTLDYLTHDQSDESLYEKGRLSPQELRTNRIVLTSLAVLLVYSVATVICVSAYVMENVFWTGWLAFVWAIPVMFIVLLSCNRKWGKRNWAMYLSLGFAWSLLLAVYMELMIDIPDSGFNLWFILLLGIPVTVAIVLAFRLKDFQRKSKK